LLRHFDVAARRCQGGQREAQRIAAISVDKLEGIDDVSLGLRHLLPLRVAHEGVDVDRMERDLAHEMQPHHHHAGDPEENDVEAGDQHVAGIIAGKLLRLLGPSQGRKRPEPGGKPGIEHVFVAP